MMASISVNEAPCCHISALQWLLCISPYAKSQMVCLWLLCCLATEVLTSTLGGGIPAVVKHAWYIRNETNRCKWANRWFQLRNFGQMPYRKYTCPVPLLIRTITGLLIIFETVGGQMKTAHKAEANITVVEQARKCMLLWYFRPGVKWYALRIARLYQLSAAAS